MSNCMRYRAMDELGEGVVNSYLRVTRFGGTPKCIDIEGIANNLGLKITYVRFAEEDPDKIGFLANGSTLLKIWNESGIVSVLFPLGTIVLDERLRRDQESGRCRFTIAHEVAHAILKKNTLQLQPQYKRVFNPEENYSLQQMKTQFSFEEVQADRLAAAILMPYFVVAQALLDFNGGNNLLVYGDNILPAEEQRKVNKMAAQIGVSYTALLIRLRQFNMLRYQSLGEYLDQNLWEGKG